MAVNDRLKIVALMSPLALAVLGFGLRAQSAQNASRNSNGMEFVKIAAGEFMMGCSTGDEQCQGDEKPRHRVQITKSFEIGKFEVTQAQWMAVMGTNPSSNKGDTLPVETVSKLEAQEFIAKLNARNDGYRYRLPTEAEWEYAARAGGNSQSGSLDEVAWYAANANDETHPVGQKKPNALGLHDMQGNVREWASDLYSPTYYEVSPVADPAGPDTATYAAQAPGALRGRGGVRGGPPGPGVRGGPVGPDGIGRGGPGFAGLNDGAPPLPPPVQLPPNATPQQQVDALRQEVQQLRQEIQRLRTELAAGPLRGGPPLVGGFGGPRGATIGPPVAGPAVEVSPGVLVDPLDGLPTGLPIVRGGGWDQSAAFQRVSARYSYYGPTLRVSDIGFRVVRVPVAQAQ
jgi:formylglycine-generating enzyme required for sulfatase activity